jgi:hypothetical protein
MPVDHYIVLLLAAHLALQVTFVAYWWRAAKNRGW